MDVKFQYCPVIKGKINDIKALAGVQMSVASYMTPLYELAPFKQDDNVDNVLARFAMRLSKYVTHRQNYIDFPMLKPNSQTADGMPTLEAAFAHLNNLGVGFKPTYGFGRDEEQWGLVLDQARISNGMLLRLERDDLDFSYETLERIVALRRHGLDLSAVDLFFDARYLSSYADAQDVAGQIIDFLTILESNLSVGTVIVSGSTAPKTVTSIEKDGYGAITRHELTLWANVALRFPQLPIVYSDYGVIHPDFSDMVMSPHINGKIRYTEGSKIHVFRGHSLRQEDKYEQYRVLSTKVIGAPIYQGEKFSLGDKYIADCASGVGGTGSPGTWVLADQNHHFTYASRQIAQLGAMMAVGEKSKEILSLT